MKAIRAAELMREAQVAELLAKGYTRYNISRKLGLTEAQVEKDWLRILKTRAKNRDRDADTLIEIKAAQYEELKREAWVEYRKSGQPLLKLLDEVDRQCDLVDLTVERNPQWLRVILDCLDAERELEGIDAPKRKVIEENPETVAEAYMTLDVLMPHVQRALNKIEEQKRTMELVGGAGTTNMDSAYGGAAGSTIIVQSPPQNNPPTPANPDSVECSQGPEHFDRHQNDSPTYSNTGSTFLPDREDIKGGEEGGITGIKGINVHKNDKSDTVNTGVGSTGSTAAQGASDHIDDFNLEDWIGAKV